MTENNIATDVQRNFAEGVSRRTVTLLQLPPDREQHQAAAHELREWCALTLNVHGLHPRISDEVTIGVSEVGVTFVPDLTDLLQILIDLNAVLEPATPGSTASPMPSPGSRTWRTCARSVRIWPATDSAAATLPYGCERPPRLPPS